MAPPRMRSATWIAAPLLMTTLLTYPPETRADDPPPTKEREPLAISKPIICKEIRGYEDFDVRKDGELQKDEKLLIYYLPLRYEEQAAGERFRVHLTQDGRIRRKGQKAVVYSKKDMLEFKTTYDPRSGRVYLQNIVSLKDLKPGEYEYDILLTDKLGGGTATRTVPFKVVATTEKSDPESEPKTKSKNAAPKKARRSGS
jgi:hypothetical protein